MTTTILAILMIIPVEISNQQNITQDNDENNYDDISSDDRYQKI